MDSAIETNKPRKKVDKNLMIFKFSAALFLLILLISVIIVTNFISRFNSIYTRETKNAKL